MIHLSIPARQALAKLTLPVLIAASFGLMLLGKADMLLAERAHTALADALAPIYAMLSEPFSQIRSTITGAAYGKAPGAFNVSAYQRPLMCRCSRKCASWRMPSRSITRADASLRPSHRAQMR